MVSKKELQNWLETLPSDAMVGVDEGGLILEVQDSEAYYEVGGMPEETI